MNQPQTGTFLTTVFFWVTGWTFHSWAHIMGESVQVGMQVAAGVSLLVTIASGIVTMSPSLRAAVDAKFKKWFKL